MDLVSCAIDGATFLLKLYSDHREAQSLLTSLCECAFEMLSDTCTRSLVRSPVVALELLLLVVQMTSGPVRLIFVLSARRRSRRVPNRADER